MGYKRRDVVGIVFLLLVIGLMVGWRWHINAGNTNLAFETPENGRDITAREPDAITVHVTGAVQIPGVYTLKGGARALDALQAAGGPHKEADEHAFNLAQPLHDGQRIEIPFKRKEGEAPGNSPGQGGGGHLININTASPAELEALPNIGPTRAAMIVDYRERHGFFASADDLMKVPGIGEKILASIRELVTIY